MTRSAKSRLGWPIASTVGVGALGVALSAPGQTVGVSVFIDHYVADLGLTSSSIASAYLIGTLGGAAAMSRIGTLIDRYGVRRSTITVGVLFGIAVLGLGLVVNWLTVVVAFVGVRMLGQGAVPLVATTWVAKRVGPGRGWAIATTLGLGQAGLAIVPVVLAFVTAVHGWRAAAGVGAVLVWVTLPLLAIIGMRDDSPIGLSVSAETRTEGWFSKTRPEALRSSAFWLVTMTWAAGSMIHTAVAYHHFAIMRDGGISTEHAAALFLPMQGAMLVGMLAVAWLSSRVGPRVVTPIAMGLMAIAMGLLAAGSSLAVFVAYSITVGIGMGMAWSQEATYLPRFFGPAHIGGIRGVSSMVNIGLAATGPLIVAGSVELAGGYRPVLIGLAAVAVVVAMCGVVSRGVRI